MNAESLQVYYVICSIFIYWNSFGIFNTKLIIKKNAAFFFVIF